MRLMEEHGNICLLLYTTQQLFGSGGSDICDEINIPIAENLQELARTIYKARGHTWNLSRKDDMLVEYFWNHSVLVKKEGQYQLKARQTIEEILSYTGVLTPEHNYTIKEISGAVSLVTALPEIKKDYSLEVLQTISPGGYIIDAYQHVYYSLSLVNQNGALTTEQATIDLYDGADRLRQVKYLWKKYLQHKK